MHRNLVLVQPYFHLISKTRYFLLPWMLFILLAGLVLITYSVSEIHLAVNSRNNGFLDFLMPWVTLGADGWTIVVACLLAIAWHRRAGIFISLACLFTSGITWLLKSTIYQGEPRPKWYFTYTEKIDLHYVPGVENWMYDSFPSGHTTVVSVRRKSPCCFSLLHWQSVIRGSIYPSIFCSTFSSDHSLVQSER
jgi:membrane-associated phospholipid phosphatase